MSNQKSSTGNGGSIERDLVRRWARRQLKRGKPKEDTVPHGWRLTLTNLIAWLDKQPARIKRPGGIGRT